MRRTAAAVILIILFMAVPAIAGQFEDATKAFKRGDYETAYRLIKPLAEQGHDQAQWYLASIYFQGKGVQKDDSEAFKWFKRSADQGFWLAQVDLAAMYRGGVGVPQDYTEAIKLYRKVADLGYWLAQFSLGAMYALGEGVPQDYVLAHMWFTVAASRPDTPSKDRESIIKARDNLASKMTPAQIAEAQKLAREWYNPKKEK